MFSMILILFKKKLFAEFSRENGAKNDDVHEDHIILFCCQQAAGPITDVCRTLILQYGDTTDDK